MITERAERLAAALTHRNSLRVDVRRVDSFQTRETQLRNAVDRVAPLARACALLRAHGEMVPGATQHVGAALQHVAALRRLYESERDAFIEPRQAEFRRFEAILEQACVQVQAAAVSAWRRYLARHRPALSGETLNVLSGIPTYAVHVRTIRELGQRLTGLEDRLPTDAEDFARVAQIEAHIQEAWGALDSAALSPAVVDFLRASSTSSGAPLALLTPAVLKWVEEHNLAQGFHVRVGEAGGQW